MTRAILWILVFLAVAAAAFCTLGGRTSGAAPGATVQAEGDVKGVAETVKRARRDLEQVEDVLISRAQNGDLATPERLGAIFILQETRGPKAMKFLVDSVSLRLGMPVIKGDDDDLKGTPCFYVLHKLAERRDWTVGSTILAGLDQERPKEDLMHLAYLLKLSMGQRLAKAVIASELQAGEISATRSANLRSMAAVLSEE